MGDVVQLSQKGKHTVEFTSNPEGGFVIKCTGAHTDGTPYNREFTANNEKELEGCVALKVLNLKKGEEIRFIKK